MKKIAFILPLIVIGTWVTGCGGKISVDSYVATALAGTAGIETLIAEKAAATVAAIPTETMTSTPTETAIPTLTPTETPTSTPEVTPTLSPTPVPFTVVYDYFVQNGTHARFYFTVTNTSSLSYEAWHIGLYDQTTGANSFGGKGGWYAGDLGAAPINVLVPGASARIISSIETLNPVGHSLRAEIKVCVEEGLTGVCYIRSLYFTP